MNSNLTIEKECHSRYVERVQIKFPCSSGCMVGSQECVRLVSKHMSYLIHNFMAIQNTCSIFPICQPTHMFFNLNRFFTIFVLQHATQECKSLSFSLCNLFLQISHCLVYQASLMLGQACCCCCCLIAEFNLRVHDSFHAGFIGRGPLGKKSPLNNECTWL